MWKLLTNWTSKAILILLKYEIITNSLQMLFSWIHIAACPWTNRQYNTVRRNTCTQRKQRKHRRSPLLLVETLHIGFAVCHDDTDMKQNMSHSPHLSTGDNPGLCHKGDDMVSVYTVNHRAESPTVVVLGPSFTKSVGDSFKKNGSNSW